MPNVWVAKTAPPANRVRGLWERERFTNRILSLTDQTSLQPHRYKQNTDTWDTAVAANPEALGYTNRSGWVPDLEVFVVCGKASSAAGNIKTYFYDPVANSWAAKTQSPITTNSLLDLAGSVIPETGTVHFIGGTEHHIYQASTDTWGTGAVRPLSATGAAAASMNGLLYVHGGNAAASNAIHIYDPIADSWTNGPASPIGMSAHSLCTLGGYVWALSGSPGFQLYDPAANTWASKSTAGLGFSGSPIITGRNSKIYALGLNGSGAAVLWEYEPDVTMEPDDILLDEGPVIGPAIYPKPERLPHTFSERDFPLIDPITARKLARKLNENFQSAERQLLALDPEGTGDDPHR